MVAEGLKGLGVIKIYVKRDYEYIEVYVLKCSCFVF